MYKDIPAWSRKKVAIDNSSAISILYKEREVWWVKIGHNIGSEQNGSFSTYSRPVLIVRGFSASLFWGLPLPTTERRGPYDKEILLKGKVSVVLLSQLRAFDTRRLGDKLGVISNNDMILVKSSLIELLETTKK